jgi:probable HAF family extracellular repeat protein
MKTCITEAGGRGLDQNVPYILPALSPYDDSQARAINNAGAVTGFSAVNSPFGKVYHPFLWTPGGGMIDLNIGAPGDQYYGEDINDSNVIVSSRWIWHPASAVSPAGYTSIPLPAGAINLAGYSINNSGNVAGSAWDGSTHPPFIYKDGVTSYLARGGTPHHLNNRNDALGDASNYNAPVFWSSSGALTTLPILSSLERGWSAGLNDRGEIIGAGRGSGWYYTPMYWKSPTDQPVDLNSLVDLEDGWSLIDVQAINNLGAMVGYADFAELDYPAYVITPMPQLAVDANRDGVIHLSTEPVPPDLSDATSPDRPFRFWVNDDDDTHGTTLTQLGQDGTVTSITNTETAPPSQPDYAGHAIGTARNLEDFARLWIDLTGLQSMVTTSGGIQVGLKWKSFTGSPAVNLYVSADAAGSDSYLKNDQAAYTQITDFTYSHAIAFNPTQPTLGPDGYPANQTVTTTGTFVFPLNLLQAQLQRSPVLHLLFEGAGVGAGQLVLVLLDKDGNQIGEGPGVWFDLMNIKSMYQRAKATADNTTSANGIDCTIPFPSDYTGPDNNNIPHPSMGWTANDLGFPFRPDPNEDLQHKTYIVFVHGWRQSPDRAGMFAETMFKRLWHLGYKGRFAAFRWPTFYDEFPAGLFTYNDSEYRAWKSGESLKQYVNELPSGYVRNVVAHSMGNIVAGAAFQRGMSASNYALLNAAVPAMCYDDSARLRQPSFSYTTPNDDSDSRTKALAYIGQLKTLNTNAVNFYLTGDSATSFDWELNNSHFKPVRYNGVGGYGLTGYAYDPSQIAGRRLSINFLFSLGRYLVDPHEAMPYAVQSLTKTVGADGRTGGSVNGSVNLDTWGFGSQHSAEWERNIQETRAFYSRFLSELQVLP